MFQEEKDLLERSSKKTKASPVEKNPGIEDVVMEGLSPRLRYIYIIG